MTDFSEPTLPDGWEEEPYDPETDEAPPFYNDKDHDCDGTEGEVDPGDDAGNGHAVIRGGAGNATDRGWGGPCSGKIVTIVRSDGVRLPVNEKVKVLIALLCDETERRGYNLVPGWCWGYACRKIRGSSTWSNHAWGLAVDLNAPTNPMTSSLKTDMPSWMPDMWNRYHFRWGGDYAGRKDAMHYEYMGTPTEAWLDTLRAQQEIGGTEVPTPEEWKKFVERFTTLEKNVSALYAYAFEAQPADVGAKTPRGAIKSQVDQVITLFDHLGLKWK